MGEHSGTACGTFPACSFPAPQAPSVGERQREGGARRGRRGAAIQAKGFLCLARVRPPSGKRRESKSESPGRSPTPQRLPECIQQVSPRTPSHSGTCTCAPGLGPPCLVELIVVYFGPSPGSSARTLRAMIWPVRFRTGMTKPTAPATLHQRWPSRSTTGRSATVPRADLGRLSPRRSPAGRYCDVRSARSRGRSRPMPARTATNATPRASRSCRTDDIATAVCKSATDAAGT